MERIWLAAACSLLAAACGGGVSSEGPDASSDAPQDSTADSVSTPDALAKDSAGGTKTGGEGCVRNNECASNACLPFAVFPPDGGPCTTVAMACSLVCDVDTDCAPLGSKFKCFATCGSAKSCLATP